MKIRLFRLFWPKSGLFRQKEDQFGGIFSKRSANRPRSDKADLLGSTGTVQVPHHSYTVQCTVQCALAQSVKMPQGSDSLLTLAVSSKYHKKQLL